MGRMEWFVVDEVSAGLRLRPVTRWHIIPSRCVQSVARNSRLLIAISVTKVGHEDCHLDFLKGIDVGNCCNYEDAVFEKGFYETLGSVWWLYRGHGYDPGKLMVQIKSRGYWKYTQTLPLARHKEKPTPSFLISVLV